MAKFYFSEDLRKYADNYKTDFQNKFKNKNLQSQNINVNQNINILTNNNFQNLNKISDINEKNDSIYASAGKSNSINNIRTFKFLPEQYENNTSYITKKIELDKNCSPFLCKYSNFPNNIYNENNNNFNNNLYNSNYNNQVLRSKFDEIDNNFFFDSEKQTNNNLLNSNNSYRKNEENIFSKETQEHNKDSYLFNVFKNPNQNFGFYSANNSPWRSGRGNNLQENFSLNNSFNFCGLEGQNNQKSQYQFHTPGNSPRKSRSNMNPNIDSPQKKSNFLNIKNKASLFNNNEKDDKGEDFNDLEELLGAIECELWLYASSQKGSRNLQKLLNKILPHELDIILDKIKEHFSFLMTDTYGNYFCQKLIQCCSSEQRVFILKHVRIFINFI